MATNEIPTLKATVRSESGTSSSRRVRAEGHVPAICYGYQLETNVSLAVDPLEFEKVTETAHGLNSLLNIELDNGDVIENVMIRDYQVHPVKRTLLHADFVAVDPDKPLKVKVPLRTEGESEGAQMGGRVHLIRREVAVVAAPSKIPEALVADVTGLGPDEAIMADDLEYPEGVEPAHTVDYALVRIQMPRAKIVTTAAPTATAATTPTTEEAEEGEEVEGEEESADEAATPPGA